jgi:ribosomal protein S18 acetylase RimI-like enzyme
MTFDKTLSPSQRDARLNAYLRVTAPQGRIAVRAGPFLATFDPKRDNPYRNYAVPDDQADPTPAEIEAFAEVCRAHGRKPRLEYAPEAAPALEAALLAAGFEPEFRPSFLTCAPTRLREVPPPQGFRIVSAETLAELEQCAAVLNDAYAEHGFDGDGDAGEMLKMIEAGGACFMAVDAAGGEAAGCGMFTPPADGVTEVAGIGVARAWRRRGLATALTSALAREAFRRGVTLAFLTPGGDEAQRAYERAGFEVGGSMLMISLSPPGRGPG